MFVACELTRILVEGSGCRSGQLVSLFEIHDEAMLLDVDGILNFTSMPMLLSPKDFVRCYSWTLHAQWPGNVPPTPVG